MYTSMFITWPHVVGRMANLQTKTLSKCRNIINSFKHWSSLKNKKNLWILTKWTGLNMLYQSWLKQLHQFKRYLFCFLKTSRKKKWLFTSVDLYVCILASVILYSLHQQPYRISNYVNMQDNNFNTFFHFFHTFFSLRI